VFPSKAIISPPSNYSGSFSNCNLMSGLYNCSNSHQLFNCSTDTNQYYQWNDLVTIFIANFTTPLPQAIKVLITYFIPDTSVTVKLLFVQGFATVNGQTESDSPEVQAKILTANTGQYNLTLPPPLGISNVNRILLNLQKAP